MPLIINGARQVGKTYSALSFGKDFDSTAYFNMDGIPSGWRRFLNVIWTPSESSEIGSIFSTEDLPERTLVIFGEIRSFRARSSLKYFL